MMNSEAMYQGRKLPNPAEDVEDQGLGFDVQTLLMRGKNVAMSRRGILGVFAVGAATTALAACSSQSPTASGTASATATNSSEIPDETAGPFPGDGSNGPDALAESGIIRSDIRSSFDTGSMTAPGVLMNLELTILDLAKGGIPFAGVAVYVWHCDQEGRYSMYAEGLENENYLRGVQIADDQGTVKFTSIYPGCYSGRWPHIHFEVYPDADSISDSTQAIATSQLAFPQNSSEAVYATSGYTDSASNLSKVTLQTDSVFGDDSGALQLATAVGDVSKGYSVSLNVPIDTSTEPSSGGGMGGMGGPPSRPN